MQRAVLIGVLVVSLVLAGCLGPDEPQQDINTTQNGTPQVTVTQNDGLSLTFQSASDTYTEGQPIVLELGMENTGEKTADLIERRLYGAHFITGIQPEHPGSQSLRGVDTGANVAGEATTVRWRIDNPVNLERGVTQSYPAGVRVKYNYRTTASADITVVPSQNFDGTRSPVTTRTSAGPLQVSVDVDNPKPIYRKDTGKTEVTIPVTITNEGDGEVADIDGNYRKVRILNAEFPNSDRAELDCQNSAALYDRTRQIPCTARIPGDIFRQQLTLRVDMAYDYFETQETTFEIRGLDGDQSAN